MTKAQTKWGFTVGDKVLVGIREVPAVVSGFDGQFIKVTCTENPLSAGGWFPSNVKHVKRTTAQLIAEKNAVIKECEASITAARAEIARLESPQIGRYYVKRDDPNAGAKVLLIEDGYIFYMQHKADGKKRGVCVSLPSFEVFYRVGD
jgi:cell division protein FtsB